MSTPTIGSPAHKEIIYSYYRLLLPFQRPAADDCAICAEPSPTTHFCSHHGFHLTCLVNQVYARSLELVKNTKIFYHNIPATNSEQESYKPTFHSTISEEHLPNCPTCRNTDGMTRLEATLVFHNLPGHHHVTVQTIQEPGRLRESFFSRFSKLKILDSSTTVLTFLEAVLTLVQYSIPSLAGRVLSVQRSFLFGDIMILARNCSLMEQRCRNIHSYIPINIAASISAYFITRSLRIPPILKLTFLISVNRVVSELGLALLSKERLRHINNAALQIFTLFNISQLHRLYLERTLRLC